MKSNQGYINEPDPCHTDAKNFVINKAIAVLKDFEGKLGDSYPLNLSTSYNHVISIKENLEGLRIVIFS